MVTYASFLCFFHEDIFLLLFYQMPDLCHCNDCLSNFTVLYYVIFIDLLTLNCHFILNDLFYH